MSSVLVINAAGRETRVALVENGHIAEFYLERKKDKGIVGNIYKGRVVRVLPGMQAAFVDIGLEKAAFLYVSDVVYDPDFARAQFELTEGEHEELADVPEPGETDPAALPAGQEAVVASLAAEGTPLDVQAPDEAADAADQAHLDHEDHDHDHDGHDHDGHDHGGHDHGERDGHDHDGHDHDEHAFDLDHEPSITSEYAVLELEGEGPGTVDFDLAARAETPAAADDAAASQSLLLTGSDDFAAPDAVGGAAAQSSGDEDEDGDASGVPDIALDLSSDEASGAETSSDASAASPAPNRGEQGQKEGGRGRDRDRRRGNKGEVRGEKRTPRDAREARQRDRTNGRKEPEKEKIKTNRETRIEDVLKVGQEVVVQISKDPIGTKGARLTSHISIPGRHLVFMPTVDHVGISRRIGNDKERKRLRDIVEKMRPPGTGFIVRTVAEGVPSEKLESDIRFLIEIWNQVVRKNERRHGPGLMHSDLDLILRATRDLFAQDVEQLVVDDREEYERILSFVGAQDANLADRVRLHESEEPIFDAYGIEQELARATQRKVWLKSGGYLIVDQAEALTAIDVNSGRYVGKKSLEETITKINVEAAKEIVYQLRLRNIGGIIICDFIDMEKAQNRDKVFKALQESLGRDKAKTNVLRISELGLIEMTRKRVRESIGRMLHEECAYCDGKGFVKTALTVAYEIFRDIRREAAGYKDQSVVINCSSEVARLLQGDERQELRHLMDRFNKTIQVRAQANYHREQYDILGRTVQGNDYRITGSSGHFLGARRAEGHGDYALPSSTNGGDRGGRDRDRGGRDRNGGERGASGERGGERGGGSERGGGGGGGGGGGRGGRDRGGRGGGSGGGRKDGARGQQNEGRSAQASGQSGAKE